MASFMWKGRNLELHLGSKKFGYILAVFSVLINFVMVLLALAADFVFKDSSYLWQCGVGFSGNIYYIVISMKKHMKRE